jgi:hypothetical protein
MAIINGTIHIRDCRIPVKLTVRDDASFTEQANVWEEWCRGEIVEAARNGMLLERITIDIIDKDDM